MDTLFIPSEEDFKRWVREAIIECLQPLQSQHTVPFNEAEGLLNRKAAAKLLNISLVTLHARMKKGLPFYKQEGSVYFIKSELLEYLKSSSKVG